MLKDAYHLRGILSPLFWISPCISLMLFCVLLLVFIYPQPSYGIYENFLSYDSIAPHIFQSRLPLSLESGSNWHTNVHAKQSEPSNLADIA